MVAEDFTLGTLVDITFLTFDNMSPSPSAWLRFPRVWLYSIQLLHRQYDRAEIHLAPALVHAGHEELLH